MLLVGQVGDESFVFIATCHIGHTTTYNVGEPPNCLADVAHSLMIVSIMQWRCLGLLHGVAAILPEPVVDRLSHPIVRQAHFIANGRFSCDAMFPHCFHDVEDENDDQDDEHDANHSSDDNWHQWG